MVANLLRLTGFGYASAAFSRLSRLIARLIRRQIQRTSEELGKDIRRVLIAGILIGLAFTFAILTLVGLHVFAGVLMIDYLSKVAIIAILLGFDFTITLVLSGVAFLLLRKPFLQQTRKEVVDLVDLISEG